MFHQTVLENRTEILLSAIHKLIKSVWKKEVLPDQLKESIIVSIHKKGDKTESNNYSGISLLSTSYKIMSNIGTSGELLWMRFHKMLENYEVAT
jgi:hypothetical protein